MLHALLSKLMKGLADEFGPGKSAMNPNRFAAALNDGSDTRIFLDVRSVRPSEIDQNQTKTEDEEPAVLLPPEELRTENGQDEI